MNWREIPSSQGYELYYQNTILAKLLCQEREGTKRRYWVTALLSILYLGTPKARKLERQRREWIAWTRSFATREERDRYLAAKKEELTRRVELKEQTG